MSVRSLCNNTADVFKTTRTNDGYGGWTESSDLVYSSMPCRIQPLSGTEAATYRREGVDVTTKAFVPLPGYESMTEDCWIKDANGKKYGIVFIANIDNMDHHLEIAMREIRSDL